IFYFLLIAPARKRQKKTQEMLDSLKNGDKVITSGGVYGTIVRAAEGEDPIRIRIATSVEIGLEDLLVAQLLLDPPGHGVGLFPYGIVGLDLQDEVGAAAQIEAEAHVGLRLDLRVPDVADVHEDQERRDHHHADDDQDTVEDRDGFHGQDPLGGS